MNQIITDTILWLLDHKVCNISEICRYIHTKKSIEDTGLMAKNGKGCFVGYYKQTGKTTGANINCQNCLTPRHGGITYRLKKLEEQGLIVSIKTKHWDSNPKRKDLFRFYSINHYKIVKALFKDTRQRKGISLFEFLGLN